MNHSNRHTRLRLVLVFVECYPIRVLEFNSLSYRHSYGQLMVNPLHFEPIDIRRQLLNNASTLFVAFICLSGVLSDASYLLSEPSFTE
ncbi:MAG TPA: hypothetical protein DIW81_11665 [Planctomycetaceae bacterium]|nr:hypothetical protein [Rubinisphaera sp.]HCS52230.1 hypothetical protein [Planctomycetaceae bacterium]